MDYLFAAGARDEGPPALQAANRGQGRAEANVDCREVGQPVILRIFLLKNHGDLNRKP